MIEIIVTGIIGVITSIVSAWVSWVFARKKYNSEVDHNVIENMENSLEFYLKLSDDNKARLEEVIERNKILEAEIQDLRKQVLTLTLNICMDLTCKHRIRETDSEDKNIKTKSNIKKNEETKS